MLDRVRDLQHTAERCPVTESLLAECDRLLASYRVGPVMLPDICVQNSELLVIRAMYFGSARNVIGCGDASPLQTVHTAIPEP
ncbi:hypothetical protein QZM72_11200 [Burkholderia sp. AU45388]|nr:hypothetical protein [Burkholderia sp. AU45388]